TRSKRDWSSDVCSSDLIHPIRLTGLVIGVPQSFEYMDKMQERVINFVVNHSGIKEEKFKELMFAKGNLTRDIGTNVVGESAVEYGLINAIGGIKEAMQKMNELIDTKGESQGVMQ